jgi:hypothetical protein
MVSKPGVLTSGALEGVDCRPWELDMREACHAQ